MPKPKNKEELLKASKENYDKLLSLINSLDEVDKKKLFLSNTLNKNIRDVLTHLYHWQIMFMEWYKVGMKGDKPDMPARGYSWKDTPQLNILINKKYQKTPLEDAQSLLSRSHKKIVKIINNHTNKELFEKKLYGWTGTTSLGAYLISCTSSHYDWALKLIKRALK